MKTASWIFVGTLAWLLVGASGCREAGPAERAGAAVDEALDGAKDRLEEAEGGQEEALDER